MRYIRAMAILAASAVLIIADHEGAQSAVVRTYVGETAQVGDGTLTSWMTTDARGKPLAVGINLSEGALSGLPHMMTEYVLALPRQASVTPFTHFALNWEPHGHVPPGIYDVPHFDFHFYMMSPASREQITADPNAPGATRQPAQRYVPDGYQAAPGVEPRMGAHWIDPASPEFHGRPFTSTFIYGFYNGRMTFIEPMVTVEYLKSMPGLSEAVKVPQAYQKAGYYPTRYAVKYDPAKKSYIVALQGLKYRKAG